MLKACDQAGKTKQTYFESHDGIGVNINFSSTFLISKTTVMSKFLCLATCNDNCDCYMTIFTSNICELYNWNAANHLEVNLTNIGNVNIKMGFVISLL